MILLPRILEAALQVFSERGVRFTMGDLAARLGMSKKTLYTQVRDKEQLVEFLVEEAWTSIKEQEAVIVADQGLDPVEKLARVLRIMPAFSASVDYSRIRELEEAYPAVKARIDRHLEGDWETTLLLYGQAVRQGSLRAVDGELLRVILASSMEALLESDFLARTGRSHEGTIRDIVDLLLEGLKARRP
jgi:AcrR family transcriptional regulator